MISAHPANCARFQLKCEPLQHEMIQQLCAPILRQQFVNQKDNASDACNVL
jgi:hypothetical protein